MPLLRVSFCAIVAAGLMPLVAEAQAASSTVPVRVRIDRRANRPPSPPGRPANPGRPEDPGPPPHANPRAAIGRAPGGAPFVVVIDLDSTLTDRRVASDARALRQYHGAWVAAHLDAAMGESSALVIELRPRAGDDAGFKRHATSILTIVY